MGEKRLNGWLIDSGATSHMTPHRSDVFDYEIVNTDVEVTIADGKTLRVHGNGTLKLTGLNNRRTKMIDVLYIPGLDRRLLSVGKVSERDLTVELHRSSCVICNDSSTIATG
uniref:Putative polyprotein n=1 Tax=Albugo laibachii Nc14 TaxID=890382 RepID=F0WU42_9STRA|nr:putative polyprotein [Albugo laibachii Nc14]|eukprot:CCA24887.1 putative polyprotein [Albugo laibachii Nc14]